jgi:hypothetical protein
MPLCNDQRDSLYLEGLREEDERHNCGELMTIYHINVDVRDITQYPQLTEPGSQ